ncbi:MAG: cytochrome C oxidase subunit IV family protein [Gemmataceae bacterium]
MSDHNHGDHAHSHGGHADHSHSHGDAGHSHVAPAHGPSHDAKFRAYMAVFVALCVFTAASFAINLALGHNHTSAALILAVAVVKAALVAYIFMHLNHDWRLVYGIMTPVAILSVMTVIILSIDGALVWGSPAPAARDLVDVPVFKADADSHPKK